MPGTNVTVISMNKSWQVNQHDLSVSAASTAREILGLLPARGALAAGGELYAGTYRVKDHALALLAPTRGSTSPKNNRVEREETTKALAGIPPLIAPNLTFTWAPAPEAARFRVVHAECIAELESRRERSRVQPVLEVLDLLNSDRLPPKVRSINDAGGTSGGSFLVASNGRTLGVFKAREPAEPPNGAKPPSSALGSPTASSSPQRDIIPSGQTAEREAAAFLLDWQGFARVPATIMVVDDKGRCGSLQAYVACGGESASDLSPNLFCCEDVHAIGLLDIRFLNTDRNGDNLLVWRAAGESAKADMRLTPVDHGLCFPTKMEMDPIWWCWYDWPQTLKPFSEKVKQFAASLDPDRDARTLAQMFRFGDDVVQAFRATSWLVRKGVAADLNLHEIASIVARSSLDPEGTPSTLEYIMTRAKRLTVMQQLNSRGASDRGVLQSGDLMLRPSSSFEADLESVNDSELDQEVLFTFVHRLLDDVVAEIKAKRGATECSTSFSVGSSGDLASRLPSPRLLPVPSKLDARSSSLTNGVPALHLT